MTETLFRDDSYCKECAATVVSIDGDAIILDRTVCYPMGGGQPGDTATMSWSNGAATESIAVTDTRYGEDRSIRHVVAPGASLPPVGAAVHVALDWARRYRHMRMHTALHLLGAVLPYGVTGGNIGVERSRLDFDMEQGVDREAVTAALQELVEANRPVTCRWISDAELDAQPELVRTMSVKPPRGAGRVRLLEIAGVDLQPCGGTHLKSTGEVGRVSVAKVEKKGKRNRRVYIEIE